MEESSLSVSLTSCFCWILWTCVFLTHLTLCLCLANISFLLKLLQQMLHVYGLTPAWTLKCLIKEFFLLNFFGQSLQQKNLEEFRLCRIGGRFIKERFCSGRLLIEGRVKLVIFEIIDDSDWLWILSSLFIVVRFWIIISLHEICKFALIQVRKKNKIFVSDFFKFIFCISSNCLISKRHY